MKVEIWSDVMCPFCYIGKRRFENALAQFEHKDEVVVEWKSYQLDPTLKTNPNKNTVEHLAQTKGWDMEYTRKTTEHVTNMAANEGLQYHFEKAVVANSFNAHRLTHLSKIHNKQNECEEALFAAHFTQGKNIDDIETLVAIGESIGIAADISTAMLKSTQFKSEVQDDIYQAMQIGIKGVPFFVFDYKYAISGAQETETFLAALYKAKQQ
ncbi:MAG: DsbA family oxidoreductase [Bacteroidota bacterium]